MAHDHHECVDCGGDIGPRPMNIGFALPDAIWDLSPEDEQNHLVMLSREEDFASLDDRYFVKGLLNIRVGSPSKKEVFAYGVWIEVGSHAEFRRIAKACLDPCAYGALSFTGKLANEIEGGLRGATVALEAPKNSVIDDTKPVIVRSGDARIQKILKDGWTEEEYQEAIAADDDNPEDGGG